MKLNLLFFAKARELVGVTESSLTIPEGCRVMDLRQELIRVYPQLAGFLDRCAIAIENEFSSDEQLLVPETTVAILPPVSGG